MLDYDVLVLQAGEENPAAASTDGSELIRRFIQYLQNKQWLSFRSVISKMYCALIMQRTNLRMRSLASFVGLFRIFPRVTRLTLVPVSAAAAC